jgi:hypothetical protein
MWIQLLQTIVPVAIGIPAVAWLAKKIVTHQLTKDVERFRSDLTIEAARDNTVFSRLHERRILKIDEVYAVLVTAESAVSHFITEWGAPPLPDGKKPADVALAAMWKMVDTVDTHRIWFTRETTAKLDDLVAALRTSWNLGASGKKYPNPDERILKMVDDARDLVTIKVPVLREVVEAEFRTLLAVELRPKA